MKIVKLKLQNQVGDNLGIENIKLILAFIFGIVDKLILVIENFNVISALAVVQDIWLNIDILRNWKVALAEARDLSQIESQELSQFFNMNFDIPNDELEQRIEEGVSFIPEGYSLLVANISFGKRIAGWYNSFGDAKVIELDTKVDLPKSIKIAA